MPDPIALPRPAIDALRAVEQQAGGREGIYQRLAVLETLPEETQLFLAALVDPANDQRGLGSICEQHGITVGQFLALLKQGTAARALLALHDGRAEAARVVAGKLPEVAADVMARAVSHTITCVECDGQGKIHSGKKGRPPVCKVCKGKGQVTFVAPQERQELALQLGGLLPVKGERNAPLVNVNTTAQAAATGAVRAGASLDDQLGGGGISGLIARADQALLPARAGVVDVAAQAVPPAAQPVARLVESTADPELGALMRPVREEANQPAEPAVQPSRLPVVALPFK